MVAKLPEVPFWFANPVLSQVRTNALELKKGSHDSGPRGAIRMIQEVLVYWGRHVRRPSLPLLPKFGPDGDFGDETRSSLINFQKENKDSAQKPLKPDGIVGDLTLGVLEKLVKLPPLPHDPAENPLPVDDTEVIPFTVDVIAFADGPEPHHVAQMFPLAMNFFREKLGLNLIRGNFLQATEGKPNPAVAALARHVFDVNQPGGKSAGGARSRLSPATVDGWSRTRELTRLQERTDPGRITVCLVDLFPDTHLGVTGVTYTRRSFAKPTIFIAKSPSCVDVFWHEICHALLNLPLTKEDLDHRGGTIMEKNPKPSSRDLPVHPDQRQLMRATARSLP